jgi:hypothetical protein
MLGGHALELAPDEVDFRRGLLTIQNPGPDLDRPLDGSRRFLTGLGALPHDASGVAIRDRDALDHDTVFEYSHRAFCGGVEWQLGLFRCFHVNSRR